MTTEEVEAFQRGHRNHVGARLTVDGVIGPETRWALDMATLCEERQRIVFAARDHIGLREDPPGSNSDPGGLIEFWLERCHAPLGSPWCAAFASWCLSQGLPAAVRQAGAQALGRRFPVTTTPTAGDLFWYATNATAGHVGLIAGVGPGEIMTLEGNSKNAVRCQRRPRLGLHFASTLADASGAVPAVVPSVPLAGGETR